MLMRALMMFPMPEGPEMLPGKKKASSEPLQKRGRNNV
jgi:hypothetical protein